MVSAHGVLAVGAASSPPSCELQEDEEAAPNCEEEEEAVHFSHFEADEDRATDRAGPSDERLAKSETVRRPLQWTKAILGGGKQLCGKFMVEVDGMKILVIAAFEEPRAAGHPEILLSLQGNIASRQAVCQAVATTGEGAMKAAENGIPSFGDDMKRQKLSWRPEQQ